MKFDIIDEDSVAYYVSHEEQIFKIWKGSEAKPTPLDWKVEGQELFLYNSDPIEVELGEPYKQVISEFDPDALEYLPVNPSPAYTQGRALMRILKNLSYSLDAIDPKEIIKAQPMVHNGYVASKYKF